MQEIADMRQALEVLARRRPSFMLRLAASVEAKRQGNPVSTFDCRCSLATAPAAD